MILQECKPARCPSEQVASVSKCFPLRVIHRKCAGHMVILAGVPVRSSGGSFPRTRYRLYLEAHGGCDSLINLVEAQAEVIAYPDGAFS